MNHVGVVAKELISRRWWWVTLVVLGLMALFGRLGVWQLHRLEERRAENAALIAALDSPPIDLNAEAQTLAESKGDLTSLANRDVIAVGNYDVDNQIVLKLQSYDSLAGVHLITPLQLAGTDFAILVDRGWVPEADVSVDGLAKYIPNAPVEVAGYVSLTEKLRRQPSSVSSPTGVLKEVFRVDVAAIQPDLPYTLLPFYVKENPPAGEQTVPPLLTAREVDLSEGPHQSYAVQWFIFALGLGVAYVIFVNHQLRMAREAQSGTNTTNSD